MTINLTTIANSQSFGTWLERTNQIVSIISSNALTADASTNGSITTGNAVVNGHFSANVMIVTNNLRGGNTSTANTITISSNALFVNNSIQVYANTTDTLVKFGSNVEFQSNVTIDGDLTTNTIDATTINVTDLFVVNTSTFGDLSANVVTLNGFLTVANSANIAGDLNIVGKLFVSGNTTFTGTSLANGDYIPVQNDYYKLGNTTYNFIVYSSNATISKSLNMGAVSTTQVKTYAFTNTTLQTVDSFATATYRSAEYLIQMANATSFQVSKLLAVHDGTSAYVTEYGIINNGTSMGVFSANVITGNFSLQCVPTSNTITAKIFKTMVTV